MVEEIFSWSKFLFGSIRKKLGWAFGILIIIILVLTITTYSLNKTLEKDAREIRDIEAPLEVMVEQVISYDALLTGNVHWALLHAEKEDLEEVKEHKQFYDDIGLKLDDLLKYEARGLIANSTRNLADKERVYSYLDEMDRVNLILVDLETRAFDAMERGDLESAYELVVTENYYNYKDELAEWYNLWAEEEAKTTEIYRQRVLKNARNVEIYNLYLGILFFIIAMIIPFLVNSYISIPVRKLKEATEEIALGNYNARVDIQTNDELQELGNSFNKTAEKLGKTDEERKQIDKAKTEFLSITSHELRSPMTPMRAQLQMLLGNYFGKLSKKQKEAVDIVLRNTERLDKIIVDFLEISRIEAARLKFNFVKANLNEHVKRLKDEMDGFLPEKKISIELQLEKLPVIEVDPDRVMQVLRNLLTNAKKFSNVGGKIIVSDELKGDYVLFRVRDFGVGIKKDAQSKVFEPFFQVDNMYQHKSGGTGLGLAICRGIVESQGGKIGFKSQEDKGTLFYFTIPLKPVKEMKPIKLLFSSKETIEKQVKEIFLSILGPMGESEFNELKQGGVLEEDLMKYVDELARQKIIMNKEEFKKKIRMVFEGKKEEVVQKREMGISEKDLTKFIKGGKK